MKTLAVSLSDRTVRFIQVNEKKEIDFVESIDTSFSFSECFKYGVYDEMVVNEASVIICDALKVLNLSSTKIAVMIDTSEAFLNIIPIDFSETLQNISSGILWDLSNYFPDSYKNFRINYYPVKNDKYSNLISDTLVIAIDNSKIEILKKIFHSCRLKINLFDIEHFSAEKYFKEIYKKQLTGKSSLILGCKKNRIDVSITDSDSMKYFEFFNFKETGYQIKLKELFNYLSVNSDFYNYDFIFLYGEDYSGDVYQILTSINKSIKIIYPDPFKDFEVHGRFKNSNKLNDGFKFISACGLALKS